MQPVASIIFIPSYTVSSIVSVLLAASVTDGLTVPGVLIGAFSIIGTYVWRFTRRADKVLVARIAELEQERNFYRAGESYYKTWALTNKPPPNEPPSILDYLPKDVVSPHGE